MHFLLLIVSICFGLFEKDPLINPTNKKFMSDPTQWVAIPQQLIEKKLFYLAAAVAKRMLVVFSESEDAKISALRALIQLMDAGFPDSLGHWIALADMPAGWTDTDAKITTGFYLYKIIENMQEHQSVWANYYFEKMPQKDYLKYLFFVALQYYARTEYMKAQTLLEQILKKMASEQQNIFFLKKVIRTLARVYFEQKEYTKSLNIYESFLLKTNPQTPSDWLEAAWNAYYLKSYQKALGFLYSLNKKNSLQFKTLESYVLRGLIYEKNCHQAAGRALSESFQKEYKKSLEGIRQGKSLEEFKELLKTYHLNKEPFDHLKLTSQKIVQEKNTLQASPLKDTLTPFIQTELDFLKEKIKTLEPRILEDAARNLILMEENLKFLIYDIEREKFNIENLFQENTDKKPPTIESFMMIWEQKKDFWHDERLNLQGVITSACQN